jgi:hypothetical protein
MLHRVIQGFLRYFRLADFSQCSLQALAIRLNEFADFLKSQPNAPYIVKTKIWSFGFQRSA